MSLETPIQIREFQRKLYIKAKQEPSYRFEFDTLIWPTLMF